MAFTFKLHARPTLPDSDTTDSIDLSTSLRVTPGEGLDPFDASFIEPQFSDSTLGEGSDLSSIRYQNRVMAFPVHLKPSAYGYAATKDGMNTFLNVLQSYLREIWRVEWADDSATKSTWYDAVFARFEPDFNFRKQQVNWISGVIRVYARPWGHTGTYRGWATAVGSSPVIQMPSTARTHDQAAAVNTMIGLFQPNLGAADRVIVGWGWTRAGVVGQPVQVLKSPAVLTYTAQGSLPTSTLTGASGAAASQVLRSTASFISAGTSGGASTSWFSNTGIDFSVGGGVAEEPGYNRVLALIRVPTWSHGGGSPALVIRGAYDNSSGSAYAMGPTQMIVGATAYRAFRVVDLGVFYNATTMMMGLANNPKTVNVRLDIHGNPAAAVGSGVSLTIDFGGLVVLPEYSTIMSVAPVNNGAYIAATYYFLEEHQLWALNSNVSTTSLGAYLDMDDRLRGLQPKLPPVASRVPTYNSMSNYQPFVFALPDNGSHNGVVTCLMELNERFTYQR